MEFTLPNGSTGELYNLIGASHDSHGVPCVKVDVEIVKAKGHHKEGDHIIHKEYVK